jgi:hypothetical protein
MITSLHEALAASALAVAIILYIVIQHQINS